MSKNPTILITGATGNIGKRAYLEIICSRVSVTSFIIHGPESELSFTPGFSTVQDALIMLETVSTVSPSGTVDVVPFNHFCNNED